MPWAIKGITRDNLKPSYDFCRDNAGLFTCVLIENGTVYLTSLHDRAEGGHHFMLMMAAFLIELYEVSQRYTLPNLEFALYTGDEAMYNMRNTNTLGVDPIILGYSKRWDSRETSPDILIPFSAHFRCYSNAFDELLLKSSNFSHSAIPWEQRKQVALTRYNTFCPYFQGHFAQQKLPRSCAREELPKVSNTSAGLLDAYSLADKQQRLTMEQHAQHRYLVSTDGWTASSKLEKYMLLGSAVLKQASPQIAYYYSALVPWVHYAPFYQFHSADILEAIAWLRENDDVAREMGKNAQRFARLHLNRPARLCYYRELFARMGRLYRYQPSCQDRPMCVPLLEELKYMGHFTTEGEATCDVHAQLDEIHGEVIDKGVKPQEEYEGHRFFHGYKDRMG